MYHSLIFKATEKKNGEIKLGTNFGNIKDFFTRQNILSDSDINAIKAYNAQIDSCITSQTAFYRTMLNASKTAQDMVANANGNTVALGNLTKASKAAEFGMKAFATVLNIVAFTLIVKGIEAVATKIHDMANESEIALDKMRQKHRVRKRHHN